MKKWIKKGILIGVIFWGMVFGLCYWCSASELDDIRVKVMESGKGIALARQEQARLDAYIKQEMDKIIGYNAVMEHITTERKKAEKEAVKDDSGNIVENKSSGE